MPFHFSLPDGMGYGITGMGVRINVVLLLQIQLPRSKKKAKERGKRLMPCRVVPGIKELLILNKILITTMG